jgi:hypothetical protein
VTPKERSVLHENNIARLYGGKRSPSSGAAISQKGDVQIKSSRTSIECKSSGCPPDQVKHTVILGHMEKIADEAWAENREPALALRYFCPDSPLAAQDGWVDLIVRMAADDAYREGMLSWPSS